MAQRSSERRQSSRLKLAPMYTMIRVRAVADHEKKLSGHIYDVSDSGLRFELDDALPIGQTVEFNALLPGKQHTAITGRGRVVRHHNPDNDPGPVRMGLAFEHFTDKAEEQKLVTYLKDQRRIAA